MKNDAFKWSEWSIKIMSALRSVFYHWQFFLLLNAELYLSTFLPASLLFIYYTRSSCPVQRTGLNRPDFVQTNWTGICHYKPLSAMSTLSGWLLQYFQLCTVHSKSQELQLQSQSWLSPCDKIQYYFLWRFDFFFFYISFNPVTASHCLHPVAP